MGWVEVGKCWWGFANRLNRDSSQPASCAPMSDGSPTVEAVCSTHPTVYEESWRDGTKENRE